jgi:hypothetical protein
VDITKDCADLHHSFPWERQRDTSSTENTVNAHGTTLTQGETYVNLLNFSTNHAIVEHLVVKPSLDLSLPHGDLLDVSCDEDELCATTSVLHASAENNHIIHVSCKNYEIHL